MTVMTKTVIKNVNFITTIHTLKSGLSSHRKAIIHACRSFFFLVGKFKNLKSLWLFLRPSLLQCRTQQW